MEQTGLDWSKIILTLVAVYGAVLSTYNLIVSRKEKQRQLSVKMSSGLLTYGPNNIPGEEAMLFITVANPGNRTVKINIPRIKLPDNKTVIFPTPQSDVTFPYELTEGDSCRIWIEMKLLAKQLIETGYSGSVKLTAEVDDATGRTYKSKESSKLNLTEWGR